MIFWIIYFSTVTYWQISQTINANAFLNIGLALLSFAPIPPKWPHLKLIKLSRAIVSVLLGLVLLWQESYLPPFKIIWNFLFQANLRPSPRFFRDFFLSHLNFPLLAGFLIIIIIAIILSYTKLKKYLWAFVGVCLLVIFITQKPVLSKDFVDRFYANEANKTFKINENTDNKFDIIILQICSLAWSDLQYANIDAKPFFGQFDYILTNFNSATPYSDPAALRLLQANCGQKTEGEIFAPVPESCYLLNNLRSLGYSTYSAWNHDGTYSNFKSIVENFGKADSPIDISGLKPSELSFDNSPIYKDGEVLSNWLKIRSDNSNKSALFYNSITLHAGNTYISGSKLSEKDEYHLATNNMIADLEDFFTEIKKSNRNTIVILLGEHGAALTGSNIQAATVRDIPLPSITQVPAAVKLFGPGFNAQSEGQKVIINKPTSYMALLKILSNLLENNFTDREKLQNQLVIKDVPVSDFVSESESSYVFQDISGVFYRSKKDKNWNQLPNSFMVGPSNYLLNF